MACSCSPSTPSAAIGTARALSRTIYVPAGQTQQIAEVSTTRRSCLVANQGTVTIVVGYGPDRPVDGGGPGVEVLPGQSLQVSTTDSVTVLNTSTTTAAKVAYVEEVA
jgi:hypothetical protein